MDGPRDTYGETAIPLAARTGLGMNPPRVVGFGSESMIEVKEDRGAARLVGGLDATR
jgi:hypothetical protein